MYISRLGLEDRVKRALSQPKHVVLHGESGCGKTWLYKKVFADEKVRFETANLAQALGGRGIHGLLRQTLAKIDDRYLTGTSESKSAELSLMAAGGQLAHEKSFGHLERDVFGRLLEAIRSKNGSNHRCALVFENLEQILGERTLLDELKGLLLTVDDAEYARHRVALFLVTTASDLRSYLSEISNANTLANRLYEIPEVGRLLEPQARNFITKGLLELLGIEPGSGETSESISDWIIQFSDRIPQYLQELCLEVAYASENSGRIVDGDTLKRATMEWLRSSMVSEVVAVRASLNSVKTKKSRRNQILFAIGQCDEYEFDYAKIESIVRKEFPASCTGVTLNVSQLLSELASLQTPLIRRVPHSTAYRVSDPKYRIWLRWTLFKNRGEEELRVRAFDKLVSI